MSHPHICNSLQISQGHGWRACQPSSPFPFGILLGMEVEPLLLLLTHVPSASSISSVRFWSTSFLLSSLSLAEGIFLGVSIRQHPEESTSQLCRGEESSHVLHPKRWHSLTLQMAPAGPGSTSSQGRGDLCWDRRGRATPNPPRAWLQHPSACSMDFSLGEKLWEGRWMVDLSKGFHEKTFKPWLLVPLFQQCSLLSRGFKSSWRHSSGPSILPDWRCQGFLCSELFLQLLECLSSSH